MTSYCKWPVEVDEPTKEKKGIRVKSDTTKLKNENILKTFRLQSLCIPQGEGGGDFLGRSESFWKGTRRVYQNFGQTKGQEQLKGEVYRNGQRS